MTQPSICYLNVLLLHGDIKQESAFIEAHHLIKICFKIFLHGNENLKEKNISKSPNAQFLVSTFTKDNTRTLYGINLAETDSTFTHSNEIYFRLWMEREGKSMKLFFFFHFFWFNLSCFANCWCIKYIWNKYTHSPMVKYLFAYDFFHNNH